MKVSDFSKSAHRSTAVYMMASVFLNTLTPKFYVALTGTSSLISGLILIFEWWYFRKYGTSFIEQVSLNHLSPWLGGGAEDGEGGGGNGDRGPPSDRGPAPSSAAPSSASECKVWRNPLSLLRGAEYSRFLAATRREPLTFYDMNLSAQDHQTLFACEADAGHPDCEVMQMAWRERDPKTRIQHAHAALEKNAECVTAYILLAEEEAPNVLEAEKLFRQDRKSVV